MNDRIFIDSNILVYSIDDNEPKKQSVANKIIWQLAEDGGTISTQVL
jgi:predicted nucleic acid-binding protein